MLRIAVLLCLCAAFAHGLSEEETAYFGTTGNPEQNTDIVGWVTVQDRGDNWRIRSNGIPDHDTGTFPAARSNPNSIQEQSFSFLVAKNPTAAAESTCLPMGPIAIAVNGVVMYNPWDADGDNAVEGPGAEVFDLCDGHPDGNGRYHYHRQPSSCLFTITPGQPSPLVGVALDGFPIYGPVDEDGNTLTSSDLDECHGRVNDQGDYQYHTTADFPYILGCYRGTPQGVDTSRENCRKAEDANEDGGFSDLSATGETPDTDTTDTGATDTGDVQPPPCSGRRCRNRQGRSAGPPSDAQVPINLFDRKLPTDYQRFLQRVIFAKK